MLIKLLFFVIAISNIGLCQSKDPCRATQITIEDLHNAYYASKAIYDDHIDVGKTLPHTRFTIKRIESEYYNGSSLTVLIAENGFTTLVVFKGTLNTKHLANQSFAKIFSPLSPNARRVKVKFDGNVTRVSEFLWEAFKLLIPGIRNKLEDQARRYIVTGHSVGGALASILSIFMKDDGGQMWEHPESVLITFGQPRVGDEVYAHKHDDMINPSRKLRFVNGLDPVPHEPPWPKYQHHSREIWMSKNGVTGRNYWKVCKRLDPLTCSNLWTLKADFEHHSILSYGDSILTPLNLFYDKDSHQHTKWLDALNQQCQKSQNLLLSKPHGSKERL